MAPRQKLQELLLTIEGPKKVYFQEPSNTKMEYPCIRYTFDDEHANYADNIPYSRIWKYQVTVIDTNKDSPIPSQVASLPSAAFSRFFVADGLNHFVYTLYF